MDVNTAVSRRPRLDRQMSADNDIEQLLTSLESTTEINFDQALIDLRSVLNRLKSRLKHENVLIVALAGPTGCGKSTLFNALTKTTKAPSGPLRPSSYEPIAAYSDELKSTPILDELKISQRIHIAKAFDSENALHENIILIDLPDIDSTNARNRTLAQKLSKYVDLLVWVLDPQKYADSRIHDEILKPLSDLGSNCIAVLTHSDMLDERNKNLILKDFSRLLHDDFGHNIPVFVTALYEPTGIIEIRNYLENLSITNDAPSTIAEGQLRQISKEISKDLFLTNHINVKRNFCQELVNTSLHFFKLLDRAENIKLDYKKRSSKFILWPGYSLGLALYKKLFPKDNYEPSNSHTETQNILSEEQPLLDDTVLSNSIIRCTNNYSAGLHDQWRSIMLEKAKEVTPTFIKAGEAAGDHLKVETKTRPLWWMILGGLQYLIFTILLFSILWMLTDYVFSITSTIKIGVFNASIFTFLSSGLLSLLLALTASNISNFVARKHQNKALRLYHEVITEIGDETLVHPLKEIIEIHNRLVVHCGQMNARSGQQT